MKTLLILRHAKSSWDEPGLEDHARPLSPRGERDAPRMGKLMRDERLLPDLIISSDAVRARSTAEAVAEAARYPGTILLEPRLYAASPAQIVAVLRTVADRDAATVMVVGHNPGLEELIAHLTGEREDMPTAALAHVTLPIERWRQVTTSSRGTLIRLYRPKELA